MEYVKTRWCIKIGLRALWREFSPQPLSHPAILVEWLDQPLSHSLKSRLSSWVAEWLVQSLCQISWLFEWLLCYSCSAHPLEIHGQKWDGVPRFVCQASTFLKRVTPERLSWHFWFAQTGWALEGLAVTKKWEDLTCLTCLVALPWFIML